MQEDSGKSHSPHFIDQARNAHHTTTAGKDNGRLKLCRLMRAGQESLKSTPIMISNRVWLTCF